MPQRKWSFVALGVVLFVLVWIRELVQMPPSVTISVALLLLIGWAIFPTFVYTDWPARLATMRESRRYADDEQAELPRRWNGRGIRVTGLLGLVAGVWLQDTVPLSPGSLTLVILLVTGFVYGSAQIASRL